MSTCQDPRIACDTLNTVKRFPGKRNVATVADGPTWRAARYIAGVRGVAVSEMLRQLIHEEAERQGRPVSTFEDLAEQP